MFIKTTLVANSKLHFIEKSKNVSKELPQRV